MTHYAFIVGECHEWPEQRTTHGDKGLANCVRSLLDSAGPNATEDQPGNAGNMVELYDQHATRSNILKELGSLLDRRNKVRESAKRSRRKRNNESGKKTGQDRKEEEDVLLFYYGGHGKRSKFCTWTQTIDPSTNETKKESWIKHSEIVDLLEQKFRGGSVWAFIDCCHAGGFAEVIVQKMQEKERSLNVKYACIMSTAATDSAGMEWTLTECFIRAFRGELSCSSQKNITCSESGNAESFSSDDSENFSHCHYLSVRPNKKREYPNNQGADDATSAAKHESNATGATKDAPATATAPEKLPEIQPLQSSLSSSLATTDSPIFSPSLSANNNKTHHPTTRVNSDLPTWENILDFLADELGRLRGDRMTTFFYGKGMEDGANLKEVCSFGRRSGGSIGANKSYPSVPEDKAIDLAANSNGSNNDLVPDRNGVKMRIQHDISWMNAFHRQTYGINDEVYVKWIGLTPKNSDSFSATDDLQDDEKSRFVAGWFRGRILSIPCCDSNSENHLNNNDGKIPLHSHANHSNGKAVIEVRDEISQTLWTITLPVDSLKGVNSGLVLGGLPFSFGGLDYETMSNAVVHLAKRRIYLDMSLPPWTRLKVLWKDSYDNDGEEDTENSGVDDEEKFYDATIMCPTEIDWNSIKRKKGKIGCKGIVGPYVPVEWVEDGSTSIVPLSWCVLTDKKVSVLGKTINISAMSKGSELTPKRVAQIAEVSTKEASDRVQTPMDAMMASLECTNKKVHAVSRKSLALPIDVMSPSATTSEEKKDSDLSSPSLPDEHEAWEAEGCKWVPVQVVNGLNPSSWPLKVLGFHTCYPESGDYSLVYWEEDSTLAVLPDTFLRLRLIEEKVDGVVSDGEGSDDVSDSDGEESDEEDTDDGEEGKNKTDALFPQILMYASTISFLFGLGFVLGKFRK